MITVVSRPAEFGASYRPLNYVFTSDLAPNVLAAETGSIIQIRLINTAEKTANPELPTNTVVLRKVGGTPFGSYLTKGQHVEVSGTTNYNGIFQTVKVLGVNIVAITAPFVANETAGTITKFYHNFSIVVNLYDADSGGLLNTFRIKRLDDDTFRANAEAFMQVRLSHHLHTIGASAQESSDGEITRRYFIDYAEEYDVPDSLGFNVRTTQTATTDSLFPRVAVNAINPVISLRNGTVERDINDGLSEFTITDALSTTKRFLTNQPKTLKIGRTDDAQLNYLTDQTPAWAVGTYAFRVETFDSTGASIAVTDFGIASGGTESQSIGIGTNNLGATITAATVKYEVTLFRTDVPTQLSETLTFTIDDNCYRSSVRFWWKNEWGGIDSYTFTGQSGEGIESSKTSLDNKYNELPVTFPDGEQEMIFSDNMKPRFANSGFVNKETALWLGELVKATKVWTQFDGLSEYVPVRLMKNNIDVNSEEVKYNVSIQYELAYKFESQIG